jgi:hypothetical protein
MADIIPSCPSPDRASAAAYAMRFTVAAQTESDRRRREIQLLVNLIQPDPEYQPFLLTDEATLLDVVSDAPEEIQRRLDCYFGVPLGLALSLPVWRYVDEVKRLRPGWPDDPDASAA